MKDLITGQKKQFFPGVTDNLASTIEEALRLMGESTTVEVASGKTYLLRKDDPDLLKYSNKEDIINFASYSWFHPLVENFHIYDLNDEQIDNPLNFHKCL